MTHSSIPAPPLPAWAPDIALTPGDAPGLVLVVDDNDAARYVVGAHLRRAGYAVCEAADAAGALARAAEGVDLVVLDVGLPDLPGTDVVRRLNADPATAHVPVLHMSAAQVSTADRVRGLEAGADAYLIRPFEPAELLATVHALLRARRLQRTLHDVLLAQRVAGERLQAITDALTEATSARDVIAATVRQSASAFGAAGVVIALLEDDGTTLALADFSDMAGDVAEAWQRFPLAAPLPLSDAAREGTPVVLPSPAAWAARYPGLAPVAEAAGHRANVVLPLRIGRRTLGALGLAYGAAREFTSAELSLLGRVAHQVAQALERARLFDAERAARTDAEAARAVAELASRAADAARAEAEEANRAKSGFLTVMSHELRTPLNAIGGYAQLMEMGIHGPVTDEQREALVRIERAQRHLLRLVNDVLNFARLDAGRVDYDVAPVRLADVVAELEPMIGPQLRAGALAYEVEVPAACVVHADREKLLQVLLNLVSNAIKFTPAGGRVFVECAMREGGGGPPGVVHLRVRDTGIGIPLAKLESVFEPFVQVDTSYSGRMAGTGLGLSISRDLARGMGGDLRVRSAPGAGTTFTLTLPDAAGGA